MALAGLAAPTRGASAPSDSGILNGVNAQLRASGSNLAAEAVELFSIGGGRPSFRIHQQSFRWVANDSRRLADGTNITYLVDRDDGRTSSSLSARTTEAALDRALATWDAQDCLSAPILKRDDHNSGPDIFDSFFGFGRLGDPFLADIVQAGWLPGEFFEAVSGGQRDILALSVTFIFVDPDTGEPTDVNNDRYLDTALNEVYYNDFFGSRRTAAANHPWAIDSPLPAIDVETVALHESGHSLGLGHFGPPPDAVMNPVYAGIRQEPLSADLSGLCAYWRSWPK
ncbi:MAG TPA: matrixin family metalloprotease [Nitriliruptorales bacterium]|nr:matrixin family metalloprotease [Nitriliruptorales bacterium]